MITTTANIFFTKKTASVVLIFCCLAFARQTLAQEERTRLANDIEKSMRTGLLDPWYPRAVDDTNGGFTSRFSYDWKPVGTQDKMIVTQARHVWSNSKAALRYPENKSFLKNAKHGFHFLRDVMWDKMHGGFYTLVDQKGNVKENPDEPKTAYGNAFGIYALTAYYAASKDTSALNLARKNFLWLEKHSHDNQHNGYYQALARDGSPLPRNNKLPTTSEIGYKDQNSSIHLLEAFTALYEVWPDPLLKKRLTEMLLLIRDTITTKKGYLVLFFKPDWTPVLYGDSAQAVHKKHFYIDHISFGHDVETAYLMLEASHVLGWKNDTTTLKVAKRMTDHALRNGWDNATGGFYNAGYYLKGEDKITILHDAKNWWSQAEGLNTLLLMADLFPGDTLQYFDKFKTLWKYTNANIIDHEHGGWYEGGLDKEPRHKTGLKGHMWKACYHEFRSLSNCEKRLRGGE
jgi:mannobiose 2-epimerase